MSAYWTVYDGGYEPVAVADAYLRGLRFGRGMALGTTRMYASNLAVFFEFCLATGRSLSRAALEFDRFVHYVAVTPIARRGRGQGQRRSPQRINHILVAVRELYRDAVARGLLAGEVLRALFRVQRGLHLPAGVIEDQGLSLHERPRHRLRTARAGRPATVSFEQFSALMAACGTWRDRSILALLGRAGLRRGEAVTLRLADVHLAECSLEVGCGEPGPHLHVRRREDLDGGATKGLDPRIVPCDELVVLCLDRYLLERGGVPGAAGCERAAGQSRQRLAGSRDDAGAGWCAAWLAEPSRWLGRGGDAAPAASQLRQRARGGGRWARVDPGAARSSADHEHRGLRPPGGGGVARRRRRRGRGRRRCYAREGEWLSLPHDRSPGSSEEDARCAAAAGSTVPRSDRGGLCPGGAVIRPLADHPTLGMCSAGPVCMAAVGGGLCSGLPAALQRLTAR